MHRRATWLLVLLAIGVASGQDGKPDADSEAIRELAAKTAYEAVFYRDGVKVASLWGLPGVEVMVEDMAPDIEAAGLTKKAIQDTVELRLRVNKVPVLTRDERMMHPAAPLLYVNVNAGSDRGTFWGVVEVFLSQSVDLRRRATEQGKTLSPGVAFGKTWHTGSIFRDRSQRQVLDILVEIVDEFCLACHKANAPLTEAEIKRVLEKHLEKAKEAAGK